MRNPQPVRPRPLPERPRRRPHRGVGACGARCPRVSRTCMRLSTTRSSPSPTSRAWWWRGRAPDRSASRARARARRSPRRWPRKRRRARFGRWDASGGGVRQGSGRRARIGGARAAGGGAFGHFDQGRNANPAQRMPAAQAAPRLGEQNKGGKIFRTGMPVVPARRAQALPQGRAMLYGQVRDRTAQLSARRARTGAHALFRVRDSAAREAEGQANLWSNGDPGRPSRRGRDARRSTHTAALAAGLAAGLPLAEAACQAADWWPARRWRTGWPGSAPAKVPSMCCTNTAIRQCRPMRGRWRDERQLQR